MAVFGSVLNQAQVEDEVLPFDDKAVALELLRGRGAST